MAGERGVGTGGIWTRLRQTASRTTRRPSLYTTEGDRHATWIELFFDLVYVVAVAQLAELLHEDLTFVGFLGFAFLFLPVWWAWTWFSYYADQFDVDDLPYRLTIVAGMFGTIVLALTIHDALHGGSAAFVTAYVVLRVLVIGMYIRAWRHVPEARDLCGRFIAGFSVAAGIWLISILVPEPARYLVWGLALLVELVTPPTSYVTARNVPAQESHMPERFGLFTIIVLGESIVAVVAGISDVNWQWLGVLAAAFGFVIAVSMWWLYFERADPTVISQAVRSDQRGLLVSHVYGYSHYLIYVGIGAASVGILTAVEGSEAGTLDFGGRLALCGGVVVFLVGVAANHWASPISLGKRLLRMRLVVASVVAVLLFVGGVMHPAVLVALVAILLTGLTVVEFHRPLRSKAASATSEI